MAKAAGIDIGSHACKVAVVDGGPKGGRLLRYVVQEYELGAGGALTPTAVLEALRKALAEARAPRNAASVAIPAEQCILREISVPFTQDEQIQRVAKFEFEPHLHSAAIEDVVVDFVKTGPARGGTRLLVIAALKQMLRTRLEQLAHVGVDPLHLDVDVAALFNVARSSGILDEHPNCLIIDIGARTTKTIYVQDGRIKVARSIRLGARAARQRIAADFEGDDDATQRAIENAASAELLAQAPVAGAATVDIVTSVAEMEALVAHGRQEEFLQRVIRETQRTLPMMGEGDAITRVFLTGGGAAQHPNAHAALAERFGAPVEALPVTAAVTQDLPPTEKARVDAGGAVAIGTALKVLGIDAGEIDLRREDFRFARTFDQVKTAVALGVTLLFFAVFLFWLTLFMDIQKAQGELMDLQRAARAELDADVFDAYAQSVRDPHTVQINGDPEKYFPTTKTALGRVQNHLKNELGLATEIPPITSCLETWLAVTNSIKNVREKIPYLAIKSEDYDQEKGTLRVIVSSYTEPDLIVEELRKYTPDQGGNLFASVDTKNMTQLGDGRIEAPIELVMLPRESAEAQQ